MEKEKVPSNYTKMDVLTAKEFDEKVKQNFITAFPAIVKQVFNECQIRSGKCVDVGAGTGLMSMEMAKNTDFLIYALEKSPAMLEVARINIAQEGLSSRIIPVLGDAHKQPFEDEYADFIISRGSYHFWDDKPTVFREIQRVLKHGGMAFIGGGFGPGHRNEDLDRMLKLRDTSLGKNAKFYYNPGIMEDILRSAGISEYNIVFDKTGLWAKIFKETKADS
jgi:ubiquinone/menaquinone biosynthesis C-methylase UbiE